MPDLEDLKLNTPFRYLSYAMNISSNKAEIPKYKFKDKFSSDNYVPCLIELSSRRKTWNILIYIVMK